MFKKLAIFEKNTATLRILILLYHGYNSKSRTELTQATKQLGIGNTAFYRSLNALKQLDLVYDKKKGKTTITNLTEKGEEIAKQVSTIVELLHKP